MSVPPTISTCVWSADHFKLCLDRRSFQPVSGPPIISTCVWSADYFNLCLVRWCALQTCSSSSKPTTSRLPPNAVSGAKICAFCDSWCVRVYHNISITYSKGPCTSVFNLCYFSLWYSYSNKHKFNDIFCLFVCLSVCLGL